MKKIDNLTAKVKNYDFKSYRQKEATIAGRRKSSSNGKIIQSLLMDTNDMKLILSYLTIQGYDAIKSC